MRHGIRLVSLSAAATRRYFRLCFSGIVILSVVSMQVTGCAPMKIPPYKADTFNTYKNQAAKNDLHIAIQPMTDKEQQNEYYGVVLTDVGVLPIFIIAENRSASQRFMLRDNLITLHNKTTKQTFPKPFQKDMADDSHLEGTKTASLIVGTVLLSLPALLLSLGLAKNSENTKAIQDNLFDKTLYTTTVLPGKTAEGFAFFKLSDGKIDLSDSKTSIGNLLLRIQATDEGTQSTQDFEFDL